MSSSLWFPRKIWKNPLLLFCIIIKFLIISRLLKLLRSICQIILLLFKILMKFIYLWTRTFGQKMFSKLHRRATRKRLKWQEMQHHRKIPKTCIYIRHKRCDVKLLVKTLEVAACLCTFGLHVNIKKWRTAIWLRYYRKQTKHVDNGVNVLIFFRRLLSSCLNWKIYCDDHSSLLSTTVVQMWIISYTLPKKIYGTLN